MSGPRLGADPEDFCVEEVPLYSPSGTGAHTYVRVEKRRRTTEEVARCLARAAGVAPREVGYAGRKDRDAVCTQWLSVPGLDPARALALELPGVRVLDAVPHPHKLRTGHLRANRFRIAVRDVDAGALARAQARLEQLVRRGMPNRFGAQRFGRAGDNPERGLAILRSGSVPRDRRAARFLLSALQAAVFDDVLAERAAAGPDALGRLEAGDVALIHASGGLFRVEDAQREAPRGEAFEISPTGPIFGSRVIGPGGAVARRESEALARRGIPPPSELPRLPGVRLRGARRPLRVRLEAARLVTCGGGARLCFSLPPGSYATVLVEELFGSGAVRRASA